MNANTKFELYKLAIEGRRTHYENFEKWMTFYYVAIGALMVAYYTAVKDDSHSKYTLLFSFIGLIISIFWHLSCKGYKYWSDNWIRVIWHFEKQIQTKELRVYSLFSRHIRIDEKKNNNLPYKYADISTPKVTLIFSFFTNWVWCCIFFYNMNIAITQYLSKNGSVYIYISYPLLMILIALSSFVFVYYLLYLIVNLKFLRNNVSKTHIEIE